MNESSRVPVEFRERVIMFAKELIGRAKEHRSKEFGSGLPQGSVALISCYCVLQKALWESGADALLEVVGAPQLISAAERNCITPMNRDDWLGMMFASVEKLTSAYESRLLFKEGTYIHSLVADIEEIGQGWLTVPPSQAALVKKVLQRYDGKDLQVLLDFRDKKQKLKTRVFFF
jgi:hypothetical protein